MKITLVVGARPNFMKAAPLVRQFRNYGEAFRVRLIHTGQHYDADMSDAFFTDLDLPRPDQFLGVGSGSHAEQTARVMLAFEKDCLENRPDLVMVVGDVNSTMACAITAKKLCIPVAHVEAGLRSRDWTMPEEINRVVTDSISDFLFTPSRDADQNLLQEGISPDKIHFVGNVMIDSLSTWLPETNGRDILKRLEVQSGKYIAMTLHRPSNVDEVVPLTGILKVITEVARELSVVWPIHPRARKKLEEFGLLQELQRAPGMKLIEPIGYIDMLTLNQGARLIVTDSGGIQEEATVLRVPCVTLRENTERPVTVHAGCNEVAGTAPARIRAAINSALNRNGREIRVPELWDGRAAERIVEVFSRVYA